MAELFFPLSLGYIDYDEVYRYSRMEWSDRLETQERFNYTVEEAAEAVSPAAIYEVCNLKRENGVLDFGTFRVDSKNLAKNLEGCEQCVVFAATVGAGIDRLTKRAERVAPSKAVIMHATGSERIERLCDLLCERLSERFGDLAPRFSPGYGDLPLELQRDIFALLRPEKIGLTLNSSLIMSPSKSVTAFVGLR